MNNSVSIYDSESLPQLSTVTGVHMVTGPRVKMVRRRGGDIAESQDMEADLVKAPVFNMNNAVSFSRAVAVAVNVAQSIFGQTWMMAWFVVDARCS